MSTDAYIGWAIVELMGHRRRAGVVREVEQFGTRLLRIDSPAGEDLVTEFYGGGAIYALRPCTEEVARALAAQLGDPRPVQPLSHRLAGPSYGGDGWDDAAGDETELV